MLTNVAKTQDVPLEVTIFLGNTGYIKLLFFLTANGLGFACTDWGRLPAAVTDKH